MIKDARLSFDIYTVRSSTLHELVEVLQYTFCFGSRCLAQVLRERKKWLHVTEAKDVRVEANQQDVV